jgi:hypothetical protein
MFDIKIECMRFARRSAAKGAGKAGWRHVNDSAVTAASFLCPTKQRSARKRRSVGHERWLRDAAALVITLSQGATMQDRNRRLYDA